MTSRLRHIALAGLLGACAAAHASGITYLSSVHSGYLLGNSAGVGAAVAWSPQHALEGFGGYGQVKARGQCLSGRQSGQPLRWEGCRSGDKSQVWSLKGSKLGNELGFCADVEGGNRSAGARLVAWSCSGATNQQWRAHGAAQPASSLEARVPAAARAEFARNAQSAPPGSVISLSTGKVVASGGGNVVAAGGANVIAAGGGNVVAAGGGN
ncbi:MAG: ricin-type beta-trefoil lectin domain protein [Pseudomonadota bacterium]